MQPEPYPPFVILYFKAYMMKIPQGIIRALAQKLSSTPFLA